MQDPANAAAAVDKKSNRLPKGLPAERVQPRRSGKPANLKEGARGGGRRGQDQEDEEEEERDDEVEGDVEEEEGGAAGQWAAALLAKGAPGEAMAQALKSMESVAAAAARAGVAAPECGWKVWRQRLRRLAAGEVDGAWAAAVAVAAGSAAASGSDAADDVKVWGMSVAWRGEEGAGTEQPCRLAVVGGAAVLGGAARAHRTPAQNGQDKLVPTGSQPVSAFISLRRRGQGPSLQPASLCIHQSQA